MICVELERANSGEFISCSAHGHSCLALRGNDIVCSAVTVLLRTAAVVLSKTDGIEVAVEAKERGSMQIKIKNCAEKNELLSATLVCVADFLEAGISSVAKEYSDNVKLKIIGGMIKCSS